jgi:hypothetical protein
MLWQQPSYNEKVLSLVALLIFFTKRCSNATRITLLTLLSRRLVANVTES